VAFTSAVKAHRAVNAQQFAALFTHPAFFKLFDKRLYSDFIYPPEIFHKAFVIFGPVAFFKILYSAAGVSGTPAAQAVYISIFLRTVPDTAFFTMERLVG